MRRSILNTIVDAVSFVVFMSMISTGLILEFVLPPGSGREEMLVTPRGRGHTTIDLYFGLTRHEWGRIHFVISLLFMVMLAVHLFLHWNFIKAVAFGTAASPVSQRRKAIAVIIILTAIFFLLIPWLGKTKSVTRGEYNPLKGAEDMVPLSP